MTSACCQSLERSSPFELIQLGWYDGITSALARCRACGRAYHAEMVAWCGDEDIRVYGFRDISPASYVAMEQASNAPSPSPDALALLLRDALAGSFEWSLVVVASDLAAEIIAAYRPRLEHWLQWFEREMAATPSDDHPLWTSFVAAENAFVAARMALIRGAADVPAIVARALRVPSERGAALRLLLILPEEQTRPYLASLVDLASVGHSDLELCRSVILRIDHGWLLSHIDAHGHAALAQGGEEVHRRIAELYSLIDAGLLQRHLERCASSIDADARAIVDDFANT